MSERGQEDDTSGAREVDRDDFIGEPPAGDARRDEFMSDDQSARRPNRPGSAQQPSGAGREDQTDEQSEDDQ